MNNRSFNIINYNENNENNENISINNSKNKYKLDRFKTINNKRIHFKNNPVIFDSSQNLNENNIKKSNETKEDVVNEIIKKNKKILCGCC